MGLFKKNETPEFSVLPESIGIIMDGNGRWAKRRGLPRSAGHKRGAEVFRKIAALCSDLGIKYVTFYCFSSENWKRPKDEVNSLMKLFKEYLLEAQERESEGEKFVLKFIGERDGIDDELLELMDKAEKGSAEHKGTVVNLAINYGGRQEITAAVQNIVSEVVQGKMFAEEITPETVSHHLYTAGQKDPDLIIRPSGEQRLSNFLIWQCAYSEFWYSTVLWPDFTKKDLFAALRAYEQRNRRFGG